MARPRRPKFSSEYQARTISWLSSRSRPALSVKKPLLWLDQAKFGICRSTSHGRQTSSEQAMHPSQIGQTRFASEKLFDNAAGACLPDSAAYLTAASIRSRDQFEPPKMPR